MRRIAAGMNHGAAMRHGKARLCRAECPPHFLFVLPKRKRAGHGTKEKTLRGDLTRRCQIIQNGGLAVTNCRPNPEVSYRLRYTYSARNCVPAPESPPHTGVLIRTLSAPLSAAAPSSPWGDGFQQGLTPILRPLGSGFQRRALPPALVSRLRERVSKGRGPQPSPFVSLGVQGEVEMPWCFSSGVWGGFFSRKECAPRPCGGNRPLRE